MIILLRHAHADGNDNRLRPLDDRGRRQAEQLVEPLLEIGVTRIFASSSARCIQTVEPLAAAVALPIETQKALDEGADRDAVVELVYDVGDGGVLCTHDNVIRLLVPNGIGEGAAALLDVVVPGGEIDVVGSVPAP